MTLPELLYQTFGFPAFRANQEAVCRAATEGRDVLLVMPTGAGKSLCYQLPAIARSGTALVISPLIALMDDQATKLSALGLRVGRIHSGLSRDEARQACRDYLDGSLQFLFIAPERMRVPGFPQMLARKKPALIAIDEAHCISAWGHDFRPDYRTLGEHLPLLRPSPIIALTATATPAVQRDIVAQLQLNDPALFIHGFRRDNLHIEVVEMSKSRRNEFVTTMLTKQENRPAIVYAPSRKSAEELAGLLGSRAAAYHAGLEGSVRERVQRDFQSGKVEVVVATIAFGMGIDKADVRTVVHIALPASVEAYYQEIGRAGRDGLPSRTVLLHSFADRKMHDFFLERDYPASAELARVAQVLTPEFQMPDLLRQRLQMDAATFDRAVEKLAVQGAAALDIEGLVRSTGASDWRGGYDAQLAFRRAQIDRMVAFAESSQCRMTALIRHFGDTADAQRGCGHCDVCDPNGSTGSSYRKPNTEDLRQLAAILRALEGHGRSTGKLHTELASGGLRGTAAGKDRSIFDGLLDTLLRAGLVSVSSEQWTNPEGDLITFKKASLTHEGREAASTGKLVAHDLLLRESPTDSLPKRSSKRRKYSEPGHVASGSLERRPADRSPERQAEHRRAEKDRVAKRDTLTDAYTPQQQMIDKALREWRKAEAASNGRPAFWILSDAILINVVLARPLSMSQLLKVQGIGSEKAERYGADIIATCQSTSDSSCLAQRPRVVVMPSPSPSGHVNIQSDSPTRKAFRRSAEDLRPLSMTTRASRKRSRAQGSFINRSLDLEYDLRSFAESQSRKLNESPHKLLSEAAIAEILRVRPRDLNNLDSLEHLRGDLPESFRLTLLATCLEEYKPEREPLKEPKPTSNVTDDVSIKGPSQIFHRDRSPECDTTEVLTHVQQLLNARLHDWRKEEAEKLGLPQFFVLSSSTLRSLVLKHPRTLPQLGMIPGVGTEKLDRFGAAILGVLNGPA